MATFFILHFRNLFSAVSAHVNFGMVKVREKLLWQIKDAQG